MFCLLIQEDFSSGQEGTSIWKDKYKFSAEFRDNGCVIIKNWLREHKRAYMSPFIRDANCIKRPYYTAEMTNLKDAMSMSRKSKMHISYKPLKKSVEQLHEQRISCIDK